MRAKTLDEIEETLDTHHNAMARRQMEGDDPGLLLHWRQAIETAGLLLESCRSIAGEAAQYREACDILAGRLETTEADRDQARADALVHLTESQRLSGRVGAYHRIVNNLVQLRKAERCGTGLDSEREDLRMAALALCPECHRDDECAETCFLDVTEPDRYQGIDRARLVARRGEIDRTSEEEGL
jgi:hypothetical protein